MLYMSKVFDDKSRRKYGLISNFIYNMKSAKEWDKKLFWAQILMIIPNVAASLLGTYLPSRLVSDLTMKIQIPALMLELVVICGVMWICKTASEAMVEYCDFEGSFISSYYAKKFVHKIMDVDYDYLEDEEFQKVSGNAWRVARFGQGVANAVVALPLFLSQMSGVIIYGILLIQRSVLLMLITAASVAISLWLLSIARKKHAQYYEALQLSARKEGYITAQATDSAAGKDIRIYHLIDWFLEKYDASLREMGRIYGIIHDWYLFRNLSHAFLQLVMDGAAFGILAHMLAGSEITAAEFVFYVGLVSGFSLYFEGTLRQVMNFNNTSASISYLREFLEVEDGWNRGEGIGEERMEQLRKNPVKVEFRNVSFTYPGSEKPTLKNINVVIKPGEKIALIGLNGAGKTTFVKLMCGFYHPTEGEILLNDIPIKQFNREEYYSLVSVLFQDSTMLALSLDENLTGQNAEDIDSERLQNALKLSNFETVYERLSDKGATALVREINKNAIDFSGGEKQRLLFARTLYLNTPLVILDEPTAALDPIAENELYLNYGKSMENKTSVYISHRLSSTRFCDRILLLEHGEIIEEGTHESLLAGNTRYAELFEVQSQYYREESERKRKSELMDDAYQSDMAKKRGVFDE
ncbi:MAG: ABC transporter ATP-binding protein/permease [Lachnospiraceae bacterium]|nr:ABC transporter ATP-binding protein/permease [Lachnospiraceae bacterium]